MRVGRYKLLFQLGAGGMAEVFLAREEGQAGVERLVVIKRVLPHLASDDMFINMLLNEARISTRLNHPNIAHIYEVGEHLGRTYIAMEFVHGLNMRSILRRGTKVRLSSSLAALVASKVAGALHHAHSLTDLKGDPLSIVHRDVSPDNIHISHEGPVKILDFGIAKARTNIESTMSGVLKGKYTYMSPEQTRQDVVDCRSDIFSLGIVLHEMLTYKKLFRRAGQDPSIVLKEIVERPTPLPSAIADRPIPEALDRIAERALHKDRELRYATAREMQEDLLTYLKQDPATDPELERFMEQLSGPVSEHQRKLREAIEQEYYPPVLTPGTPSESLPTWSGPEGSKKPGGTTAVLRARRRLRMRVAVAAFTVAVATLVAVLLWKGPEQQPVRAAVKQSTPDAGHTPDIARIAAPAQLLVKSAPSGAEVWVDGSASGQVTPTVVKLKDGAQKVALVLKLAGHVDDAFVVSPTGGLQEVVRTLSPEPRLQPRIRRPPVVRGQGLLTINAVPWAEVYIDGRKAGVTPLIRHRVASGRRRVRLRNPDRKLEQNLVIDVPRNGEVKRNIKL